MNLGKEFVDFVKEEEAKKDKQEVKVDFSGCGCVTLFWAVVAFIALSYVLAALGVI